MTKSSIFISYARKDGREFAAELREKLIAEQFSIWQDVVSLPPGEPWWLKIKEAIENVQTMVLILTDAALTSEPVRREYAYARHVGIQIIPVTKDAKIYRKPSAWIKRDIPNLDESQTGYADNWSRLLKALESPPACKPVPNMAEPLSNYFTERPELQTCITDRLLDETHLEPCPGTTVALLGAGGFGKTTLAQAVCFNPEVVDAYTGGILWATLGESGEGLTVKLAELVRAISGAAEAFNAPEDAARRLHKLLTDRECLIVLDDVWDMEHIKHFRGAASCTYLITTRDRGIAAQTSTQSPIDISETQTAEAVALLVNHLPEAKRPVETDHKPLAKLAARLGEWPLLLGIVGGTLREEINTGSSLEAALDWVNGGLDSEGLTAFDRTEGGRNSALAASMNASLRRYTDDDKRHLFELSIFREDVSVPEAVAHKLWMQTAGLKPFQSSKLLRRLAGQFFLMGAVEDGPQAIRFHDRLREYLAVQLGDLAPATHNALLAAYNPPLEKSWHEIPDDSYLYNHLVYHLVQAGLAEELPSLFANDAWMRARWEADGYIFNGFIDDLTKAWEISQQDALMQVENGEEPSTFAQCVRYALIRTSINSISSNYVPEFVARAVELGVWTTRRALAVAANVDDEGQQVRFYALLLSTGKLNDDEKHEALQQALRASRNETHIDSHIDTLITLLPYVSDLDRESIALEALATARQVEGDLDKAKTLLKIIPHLPESDRIKTLREVLILTTRANIDSSFGEKDRIRVLTDWWNTPKPDFLVAEALDAATNLNLFTRAKFMAFIALGIPESLVIEAIHCIRTIHDEEWPYYEHLQLRPLMGLAKYLPEPELTSALTEAYAFVRRVRSWDDDNIKLFLHLIPYLSLSDQEAIFRNIFTYFLETSSEDPDRIKIITSIAPYVPDALVSELLAITEPPEGDFVRFAVMNYTRSKLRGI